MTNTLEQITQNVAPVAASNINQVIIEMLSGVKTASGEIYGISKEAVHQSVAFIQVQAPDVISQFCQWKFIEAAIWAISFFLASIVILSLGVFFYRKLNKYSKEEYCSESQIGSYVILIFSILISSLIFFLNVPNHIQTAAKIKIAPKVYVIEYIVDKIKK